MAPPIIHEVLPNEIFVKVLKNLDHKSTNVARGTCTKWKQIIDKFELRKSSFKKMCKFLLALTNHLRNHVTWHSFLSVDPSSILIAEDNCKPENANTSVEIITSNHTSMMQQLPNLPIMFKAFMTFVHDKSIMMGGTRLCLEEPWGEPQVKHECIMLKGGKWSPHSQFNENRFSASLASTSSATFVFGGWKAPYTYEYLAKDSSTWVMGEEVIRAGFHWGSAVTISEEEIWLIGGSLSEFYHPTSRIISFDTITHTFSYLDVQLIEGRFGHRCAVIPETNIQSKYVIFAWETL